MKNLTIYALAILIGLATLTGCKTFYTHHFQPLTCQGMDCSGNSYADKEIIKTLNDKLSSLLKQGKATKTSTLIKQLSRGSYKLSLPMVKPAKNTPASIYNNYKDSILIMGSIYKCDKCDKWHETVSTGFAITASGIAVTNYHVVNNPSHEILAAMTADGKVYPVKKVLAASKKDDLAILQLEGDGFQPIPLSRNALVGSPVTLISHPEKRFYSLTQGVVSRYFTQDKHGQKTDRMAITADFAKGSSGAPVIGDYGTVVGVVSSTHSIYYSNEHGQDKNLQMVVKYCIPSDAIYKLIEQDK